MPTHQTLYQLDHDQVRRGIAHLFSAEQWATAPQRLFPAWLRTHPTDRDTYARLKQTLRDTGTWGHDYTAAKAAFVNRISAREPTRTLLKGDRVVAQKIIDFHRGEVVVFQDPGGWAITVRPWPCSRASRSAARRSGPRNRPVSAALPLTVGFRT